MASKRECASGKKGGAVTPPLETNTYEYEKGKNTLKIKALRVAIDWCNTMCAEPISEALYSLIAKSKFHYTKSFAFEVRSTKTAVTLTCEGVWIRLSSPHLVCKDSGIYGLVCSLQGGFFSDSTDTVSKALLAIKELKESFYREENEIFPVKFLPSRVDTCTDFEISGTLAERYVDQELFGNDSMGIFERLKTKASKQSRKMFGEKAVGRTWQVGSALKTKLYEKDKAPNYYKVQATLEELGKSEGSRVVRIEQEVTRQWLTENSAYVDLEEWGDVEIDANGKAVLGTLDVEVLLANIDAIRDTTLSRTVLMSRVNNKQRSIVWEIAQSTHITSIKTELQSVTARKRETTLDNAIKRLEKALVAVKTLSEASEDLKAIAEKHAENVLSGVSRVPVDKLRVYSERLSSLNAIEKCEKVLDRVESIRDIPVVFIEVDTARLLPHSVLVPSLPCMRDDVEYRVVVGPTNRLELRPEQVTSEILYAKRKPKRYFLHDFS